MSWQKMTKEMGLAISVVKRSGLNLATRIDAEHYQPHYMAIINAVQKKNHKKLSELVSKKITTGHTPSMADESFYGGEIKFIKTDNLRENQIIENFSDYLTDKGANKLKNALLQEDDVVLTIIGATYDVVGRVARIFSDLGRAAINQNISLVRPTIASGFLSCFLMGKYGKQQLYYLSRQTEQVNLNNTEVADVLVPIPNSGFEQKIHAIHNQTHEYQTNAKKLYAEAEELLLKEIGLDGFRANDEAITIRSYNEAATNNRFDAEYWQPKYDEVERSVSDILRPSLGELASAKKGIEVGSEAYVNEGRDFLRVSDFTMYGIESTEKKISEELYQSLKVNHKPEKGEVLFTKDGTVGISFALNQDIDAIVSSAFLRLKPKMALNATYLALALNSTYCKMQIERMSGGAIISHLKPDSAMTIKVPILPNDKQEVLANKVSKALELQQEAHTLLKKAKRAVEVFIEKDEESALAYLNE